MGIMTSVFSVPDQLKALPEPISHDFFLKVIDSFWRNFLISVGASPFRSLTFLLVL